MGEIAFYKTQHFKELATELDVWQDVDLLKKVLAQNPERGSVIPGGDGLRKIRMPLRSRGAGSRGGARVIYYRVVSLDFILFVDIYEKSEQENLVGRALGLDVALAKRTVRQIRERYYGEKPNSAS